MFQPSARDPRARGECPVTLSITTLPDIPLRLRVREKIRYVLSRDSLLVWSGEEIKSGLVGALGCWNAMRTE